MTKLHEQFLKVALVSIGILFLVSLLPWKWIAASMVAIASIGTFVRLMFVANSPTLQKIFLSAFRNDKTRKELFAPDFLSFVGIVQLLSIAITIGIVLSINYPTIAALYGATVCLSMMINRKSYLDNAKNVPDFKTPDEMVDYRHKLKIKLIESLYSKGYLKLDKRNRMIENVVKQRPELLKSVTRSFHKYDA